MCKLCYVEIDVTIYLAKWSTAHVFFKIHLGIGQG